MTVRVLLLPLIVACLAGCADETPRYEATAEPSPAASSPTPSPSPRAAKRPTPHEVVNNRDAILAGARLRRTDDGFLVVAEWILSTEGRARRAIATSDDGFQTVSYEPWTHDGFYALIPFEQPSEPGPPVDGLLASPAVSLHRGTLGYVLGGDGATLFPFERTARSTDGGRSWTTFDVPRVDGEMGYLTGQVVLSDGRLLVNLTNWSGDRRGRPSDVHHGLWISDGADWSAFQPYKPRFSPPLAPDPPTWPAYQLLDASNSESGSAIWITGAEGLLYMSIDDAQTFAAIPAR